MDRPVREGDDPPLVPPPGDHLAHVEPQDEGQRDPAGGYRIHYTVVVIHRQWEETCQPCFRLTLCLMSMQCFKNNMNS